MLEVEGLHHEYLPGVAAIDRVDVSVARGEFVSIVGPSGCGKTTLMKCISGLLSPTSGRLTLLGEAVVGVPDGLAMVFQDYARSLYPWMSVWDNVDFPLRYRDVTPTERKSRVEQALDSVGLLEHGDKHPWQLSGGMQQRAAIARALAYGPNLLLMDEPFASVDAQTRADLEDLVASVHRATGVTVLFVTHDIDEAVYLADRVVVLSRSPSRTIAEIAVDLPPVRDQIETRALPRFVELRSQVASLIRRPAGRDDDGRGRPRQEVMKGMG